MSDEGRTDAAMAHVWEAILSLRRAESRGLREVSTRLLQCGLQLERLSNQTGAPEGEQWFDDPVYDRC